MVAGGGLRKPKPVQYFNAIMYNPAFIDDPDSILMPLFGRPVRKTEPFLFSHTTYYSPEMGEGLVKYFAAYDIFELADRVVDYKLQTVDLERTFLKEGSRVLNVDPGYVAIEKVVAASTKNFTHRIYLRDSIYADMQLTRRNRGYEPLPWTYQDYAFPETIAFFEACMKDLARHIDGGGAV